MKVWANVCLCVCVDPTRHSYRVGPLDIPLDIFIRRSPPAEVPESLESPMKAKLAMAYAPLRRANSQMFFHLQ